MPPRHTSVAARAIGLCTTIIALLALALAGPAGAAVNLPNPTTGTGGGGGSGGGAGNQAPVAVFTISPNPAIASMTPAQIALAPDPKPVDIGSVVTFDASQSTDDAGIVDYAWDLNGDGRYEMSGPDMKVVTSRFIQRGTVDIGLRVTDTDGATDTATEILSLHDAPHAAIAANVASPRVGQVVTYDAVASTADPAIADYKWDLDGNGTFETDTGAVPAAATSYATAGVRTVAVRVTDTFGTSVDASLVEHVTAAPASTSTSASGSGPVRVTTTTPPATKRHAAPRLTIAARRLAMSRAGVVAIRVACPASARSCSGALELRTLNAAKLFRVAGGHSATVRITLPAPGRRLVARRHALSTAITAVSTDPAGDSATTRTAVRIAAPGASRA